MAVIIPTTGIGDTTPSVATEEIGGVHYQAMKLYTGTTGTATVWDGGITTGQVQVRNITTGQVAALIQNWTTATYVTTGSLMVQPLSTARSIVGTPSFSVSGTPNINITQVAGESIQVANGTADKSIRVTVANDSTGIIGVSTGNVSAQVRSVTTGNVAIANTHTYVDVLTTGNVAIANTHTYIDVLTTGNVAIANTHTYIDALTTGNVAIANTHTYVDAITTGSIMVGQLTTARSLSTGSISAIVANWPTTYGVTGYVAITTGQVSIPNVVNVTGSLAASFATTAFQVTTGNINVGNVVNVTGIVSASFDSTNMIVNSITTGYVAAWIVNGTAAAIPVTGTFSASFATTAMTVVSLTTGNVAVANTHTYVDVLTTGNISADVRNVTTGTLMVWPLTTARSVISLTTGNIAVANTHTYVDVLTTGNVAIANTHTYIDVLTTGNFALANTHTYVDVLTTGNISAIVRDVTTGTLMVWPLTTARSVISLTTGNIAVANTHTYIDVLTTGNIAVANTHTYVDVLTTGNISATVRDVTTGTIHVIPYGDKANYVYGVSTNIGNTTLTIVLTSQGANVGAYLTHISAINAHTTVGTWVTIMNGDTTAYSGFCVANGGGFASTFPVPLPGKANNPWSAKCETSGAQVRVSLAGYKGPA